MGYQKVQRTIKGGKLKIDSYTTGEECKKRETSSNDSFDKDEEYYTSAGRSVNADLGETQQDINVSRTNILWPLSIRLESGRKTSVGNYLKGKENSLEAKKAHLRKWGGREGQE